MSLKSSALKPKLLFAAAVILLVITGAELVLSVRNASQTWDEGCHIYAGYSYWTRGDFGMNPEHPPLVKLLATLPLLGHALNTPTLQDRYFKLEAFFAGRDFIFKNDADWLLFRVRMAAAVLALLLAVLVFAAACEMFGPWAGLLALALLAFEPNILAHGAWVTTDVGLSCFLFGTVYAFYRFVKRPSLWRLLIVGIATGFVFASKHSGILIVPMLILLALAEVLLPGRLKTANDAEPVAPRTTIALRLAASLVAIGFIAVLVLWSFYGFRYSARPDGLKMNPTLAEFTSQLHRPFDKKVISATARLHLLPEAYLYGLTDVRNVSDFSPSYIFGKVYPHGVWFYFPAAFVIKSTLGLLALLLLVPVAIALRKLRCWREILFLTLPPLIHFGQAMASGLNIGLRHILPIYPFLAVLAAGAAWALIRGNRRWAYVVIPLVACHASSSLRAFPNYLSYANEAWGGPANTYKYLTDSNVDWGQQLKTVHAYLDQRGVKNCWFAYFVSEVVDTNYYGVPCKMLPTISSLWLRGPLDVPPSVDRPVLISASVLSGYEFGPGELNPYAQFQKIIPTAVLDHGVFVYDGHFDVPLAAAFSHNNKASKLADENQLDRALLEAQKAVELAPRSAQAHANLGDLLTRTKRPAEARKAFQSALSLAETIQPEYQKGTADDLRSKLATN